MKDYIIDMGNGTTYTFLDCPQYVLDAFARCTTEELSTCCTGGEVPLDVYERIQIELVRRRLKL